MSFLDDLADESKLINLRRSLCTVCRLINSLDDPEREALLLRMGDPEISHASISRILKANGYDITEGTLGRHRRNGCQGVA